MLHNLNFFSPLLSLSLSFLGDIPVRLDASNLSLRSGSADAPHLMPKWYQLPQIVCLPATLAAVCTHSMSVFWISLKPVFSLLPLARCCPVCVCMCVWVWTFTTGIFTACLRTSSNHVLINSLIVSLFIYHFIYLCSVFLWLFCELFLLTLRLALLL